LGLGRGKAEGSPVKWAAQWNTEAILRAEEDFTGQGKNTNKNLKFGKQKAES
jgi:hypothetical protein